MRIARALPCVSALVLCCGLNALAQHADLAKLELNNRYNGAAVSTNQPLTWSWREVPGATKYFVWPTWDPRNFGHFEFQTSFRASGVPTGKWDIGVTACNESGCGESMRDSVEVMMPAPRPVLTAPLQGAVGGRGGRFCWKPEESRSVGPLDYWEVSVNGTITKRWDLCANFYSDYGFRPGWNQYSVRGVNAAEPSIWVSDTVVLN